MKTCSRCKEEKELSEFYINKYSKGGFRKECKICKNKVQKNWELNNKEKIKEVKKKYHINNKEKIKERSKEYRLNNKEKIKEYRLNNQEYSKEYSKEYRLNNKEKINEKGNIYRLNNKEKAKEYRLNNKEKANKRFRERKLINPLFKLRFNIRNNILSAIKRQGFTKKTKTYQILGCAFEEFKQHLEKQFTEGMTWKNQGEWHLDHIYPVSLAKDEEELIRLNHYTNFQPLWAEDNLKKGNKIIEKQLILI